jgi:ComF family protein
MSSFIRNFIELFFPRTCCVCGAPLVGDEAELCIRCLLNLPEALTSLNDNNFVEKRFIGRLPIEHCTALLLYKRGSDAQTILHQIKYYGNEKLAIIMGRQLGLHLKKSGLFNDVDLIMPVPLHRSKERKRGYNQSLRLCQGIVQTFPRPIVIDNLVRIQRTDSQTHKTRLERLDNIKGVFAVKDPEPLKDKHLLLIDDVITTGATTEACWTALKGIEGLRISIAALAVSGDT